MHVGVRVWLGSHTLLSVIMVRYVVTVVDEKRERVERVRINKGTQKKKRTAAKLRRKAAWPDARATSELSASQHSLITIKKVQ